MRPGDQVPDFELEADDGRTVRLSEELAHGPVVLFFYPRAMTPGCTQESCMFRDRAADFEALGARRLGISTDSVARQQRFTARHGFGYPLLSDPGGRVARAFGVKRGLLPVAKRTTFVIGTDGRLLAEIHSELNIDRHGDEALAALAGGDAGPA